MCEKKAFTFYQLRLAKVEGSHPLHLKESQSLRLMKALQSRILSQKVVGFDGILRGFSASELCFGMLFIIRILMAEVF
jgi:hypothetical protein